MPAVCCVYLESHSPRPLILLSRSTLGSRISLLLQAIILAPPISGQVSHIFNRPINTSIRKVERQHHQATPEDDAEGHSYPEHDCLNEHVEDLEREEEDDEGERDGGEVGLFDQLVDGGDQVFVEDIVEGV